MNNFCMYYRKRLFIALCDLSSLYLHEGLPRAYGLVGGRVTRREGSLRRPQPRSARAFVEYTFLADVLLGYRDGLLRTVFSFLLYHLRLSTDSRGLSFLSY